MMIGHRVKMRSLTRIMWASCCP